MFNNLGSSGVSEPHVRLNSKYPLATT